MARQLHAAPLGPIGAPHSIRPAVLVLLSATRRMAIASSREGAAALATIAAKNGYVAGQVAHEAAIAVARRALEPLVLAWGGAVQGVRECEQSKDRPA